MATGNRKLGTGLCGNGETALVPSCRFLVTELQSQQMIWLICANRGSYEA